MSKKEVYELPPYALHMKAYIPAFDAICLENAVEVEYIEQDRIMQLNGRVEDVDTAKKQIKQHILNKNFQYAVEIIHLSETAPTQRYEVVGDVNVPIIVGKKGETIRRLEKETGAKIRIGPGGKLGLFGAAENIKNAWNRISKLCKARASWQHGPHNNGVHTLERYPSLPDVTAIMESRTPTKQAQFTDSPPKLVQHCSSSMYNLQLQQSVDVKVFYQQPSSKFVEVRAIINRAVAPLLIGKKGSTKRGFEQELGVKIDILTDLHENGMVPVIFKGADEKTLEIAKEKVMKFVSETTSYFTTSSSNYCGYKVACNENNDKKYSSDRDDMFRGFSER